MKISKWQIWQTYCSYVDTQHIDIDWITKKIVSSDFASTALTSSGDIYWKEDQKLKSTNCQYHRTPDDKAAFTPPPFFYDERMSSETEAMNQFFYFKYAEQKLFRETERIPAKYARFHLGTIKLFHKASDTLVNLYATLLVYQTGVMTLEMRMFSPPEGGTSTEELIHGGINLFDISFDTTYVRPAISKLATESYQYSCKPNTLNRIANLNKQKLHNKAIDELTIQSNEEDLKYFIAPLSGDDEPNQLKDIALTIFSITEYLIKIKRSKLAYVLLGCAHDLSTGLYWSGRPHTYLINFENQQSTAEQNETLNNELFKKIICRNPDVRLDKIELKKSPRLFDDYSCFFNKGMSLWAWSSNGIKLHDEEVQDINYGHLIYEPQTTIELMEYMYMLHKKLLDSIHGYKSIDDLLSLKASLNDINQGMGELSNYGEIVDALNSGWEEIGLTRLKNQIDNTLDLRLAEMSIKQERKSNQLTQVLTIIFGMVAVPSLASQIIAPGWKLLGLPALNTNVFLLTTAAISIIIVLLCIFFCHLLFKQDS